VGATGDAGVEPGDAAAIAPHSLKAVPRKPRVVLW